MVLVDELLNFFGIIVDPIRREREPLGIEPMMIPAIHLGLEIIANPIDQVYFEERFSTDEIPDDAFFLHLRLTIKNIINCFFSHIPSHTLVGIFPDEVAILTSKLAVFCDYECDAF